MSVLDEYYGSTTKYQQELKEKEEAKRRKAEKEKTNALLEKIRDEISADWYTKPKNRYEEGKKDEALRCMEIIRKYMEGKE